MKTNFEHQFINKPTNTALTVKSFNEFIQTLINLYNLIKKNTSSKALSFNVNDSKL